MYEILRFIYSMQLLTIAVCLKQLCICDCDAEFLKNESSNGLRRNETSDFSWLGSVLSVPFSDVTPLVGCQEGHQPVNCLCFSVTNIVENLANLS